MLKFSTLEFMPVLNEDGAVAEAANIDVVVDGGGGDGNDCDEAAAGGGGTGGGGGGGGGGASNSVEFTIGYA